VAAVREIRASRAVLTYMMLDGLKDAVFTIKIFLFLNDDKLIVLSLFSSKEIS